jgi:hypothetical protein
MMMDSLSMVKLDWEIVDYLCIINIKVIKLNEWSFTRVSACWNSLSLRRGCILHVETCALLPTKGITWVYSQYHEPTLPKLKTPSKCLDKEIFMLYRF